MPSMMLILAKSINFLSTQKQNSVGCKNICSLYILIVLMKITLLDYSHFTCHTCYILPILYFLFYFLKHSPTMYSRLALNYVAQVGLKLTAILLSSAS